MLEQNQDAPPAFAQMFINSSDTLQGRMVDQTIPAEWNDRPPLFKLPPERRRWGLSEPATTKEEDPTLLKGMLRKGVPPPLRCAVWLSNVIQSSHPHQELKHAHEYRTLSKVRVLDFAYDALWQGENAPLAGSQLDDKVDPSRWSTFGNKTFLKQVEKYPPRGQLALQRVLHALEFVLGVEYAPMIPALTILLLSTMSQSYAFTAVREMAHHSTWYYPCSRTEHVAHGRCFMDVLMKLHPSTASTIERLGVGNRLADAIFQDFFVPLLPERYVLLIMDIYTLEGTKVLFRIAVALVVLYQKEWKSEVGVSSESESEPPHDVVSELESTSSTNEGSDRDYGERWWNGLVRWADSTDFNWDLLVRKAYGVHGKGVRKRYRFPRRPILARILKLEEERYMQEQQSLGKSADAESTTGTVFPIGLVVSANASIVPGEQEPIVPLLGEPAWVRTKLAEWLPLSLRLTKMDLIFSSNHHGRTLDALYRHCQKAKHTVMLIEPLVDDNPTVHAVGMYASQTWKPSVQVYGDGECFLFRLIKDDNHDDSKCWKWKPKRVTNAEMLEEEEEGDDASPSSAANNRTALLEQFQVSTESYISMGGNPDGSSGLRLNEDMTKAESSSASGFDNEPLTVGGFFEVGLVEVYQLVRPIEGG